MASRRQIPQNFIENSSCTLALVETASLTGTAVAGTEVVLDAVGISDGEGPEYFHFGAPMIGPDGANLPAGAIRVESGVDADQASDFVFASFQNDLAVNQPSAGTFQGGNGGDYVDVKIHQMQGSTNLADGTLVGVAGGGR